MSPQGSSFSKDVQGSQRSQGSGRASRQRRKRRHEVAKQAIELLTRTVRGAARVGKERSSSSQGLEGHDGEGFQTELNPDIASLPLAGNERRASLVMPG